MDSEEEREEKTPPAAAPAEGVRVLRVIEGPAQANGSRTFSVYLSAVLSADVADLAVVAAAVDPRTKVAIPAAGSPHPTRPGLIARPPMIYDVALRDHGGGILSPRSRFYNVSVRYVPAPPPAGGS